MTSVATTTRAKKKTLRAPTEELTAREIEIIRMIANGLRNKDIGESLLISEGTVKAHLHNIYTKLQLHSRVTLALYARDRNLF